jgi:hypothetical protein
MAQNRESFLLNRSLEFDLATGAENHTDLTLTPNPDLNKSPIVTNVLVGGAPLPNAMVKVLTPAGDPIDHQFTNAQGTAISRPLPTGTYQVVVSAPGYVTSLPVTVNLAAAIASIITVTLEPDPRALQNTVYGLVLDQAGGTRLSNATVTLADTIGQTVSTTLTNSDGEYLMYQVQDGSYTITAAKTGYELSTPLNVTVSGGQIAQTNISLTAEVQVESTVQGFIRDQNNNFLPGALVGLYSVTDSVETLIQQTFANANGFYLFGNVPAGRYLVKAKVEVTI